MKIRDTALYNKSSSYSGMVSTRKAVVDNYEKAKMKTRRAFNYGRIYFSVGLILFFIG